MATKVGIFILLLGIFVLCPSADGSEQQEKIRVPGKAEGITAKDILSDFSWIIALCTFSILLRFKQGQPGKLRLFLLVLVLLVLAALHSHPLWSFSRHALRYEEKESLTTRIVNIPATIIPTGLEIDDIVPAMNFDPGGRLWIIGNQGGPYIYSPQTNEFTTLLRPDSIQGLFPDPLGMWSSDISRRLPLQR